MKKQNTVYVAGIGGGRLKGPRAPPEENIKNENKKETGDRWQQSLVSKDVFASNKNIIIVPNLTQKHKQKKSRKIQNFQGIEEVLSTL